MHILVNIKNTHYTKISGGPRREWKYDIINCRCMQRGLKSIVSVLDVTKGRPVRFGGQVLPVFACQNKAVSIFPSLSTNTPYSLL